jgi:DNA-binding response OmpR family regulator
MPRKKIIAVDDNQANLTACRKTLKDEYEVYPAPSAEKMFELLTHITPDLILLDVEMPGTNGYDAMRRLRSHDAYRDIPVIFLSAMDDAESEIEGLNLGAIDYIHKPFVSSLLLRRIQTHIAVVEGKKELMSLNKSISQSLSRQSDDGQRGPSEEAEEKAIKELMIKGELLSRMGHEILAPLNVIIQMIETAIKTDDLERVKHYLGIADAETRLILEIVNDIYQQGD